MRLRFPGLLAPILFSALAWPAPAFAARRSLRLEGVPPNVAAQARRAFPSAFDGGASLADVDDVVRYLMGTGAFSYVEAGERSGEKGPEAVVTGVLLRRVSEVKISGNKRFSDSEIRRRLNVSRGDPFERKNLQSAADQITKDYGEAGYVNARAAITFETPTEKDVVISVVIDEGKPCQIVDAIFDVSNPELRSRLQSMAKPMLGEPLSNETVYGFQARANEWFQSNRYLTAKISSPSVTLDEKRERAKLTWQLESPYKWDFIFEGNAYYGDGLLVRAMELDKLAGVSSSPAVDLAERVRKKYLSTGFAHASVDYQEKSFDDIFKRQIRFKIYEGPRVRIRKIEVAGSISRPERYYSDFIAANSSELVSGNFYGRADIEKGAKNLVVELQNQGFLRAKTTSTRIEFDKSKEYATISIQLDEGPLTQLRQIKFDGVSAFSKAELADVMTIKGNAPLSLHALEESLQLLKRHYRDHGYLEMKILNENEPESLVSYNDTNTQANVEVRVQEGPKVVVASIVSQGNAFTKDEVIVRELSFKKGDVLTPDKIDDSTIRLQRMALFSRVSIRTLEEGQNVSERTVIVEVDERDPGLFSSGLGMTNELGLTYRGFVGFAYRNIKGTARSVSARLDMQYSNMVKYPENKVSLGYAEPYLFGAPNRGRVNFTRKQELWQRTDADHYQIRDANIIEFLLERDVTRHLKFTYTPWRFSNDKVFDRDNPDDIKSTQNIGKTGVLFEYDLRNDTFNPTRGAYTFSSFEYSNPVLGSSNDATQLFEFFKTTGGATHYLPLSDSGKWVWANAVRSGYVANLSNRPRSGVPAVEAFFLGGRSTIRGYDPTDNSQIIPNYDQLGIDRTNDTGLNQFTVRSDSWYYLLKTELRFPVYGVFGGAIFYDGGAVYVNQGQDPYVGLQPVDPDNAYRHSVGVAVRIATPVGPVNLEVGFKLNRRKLRDLTYEAPVAYHFSIGAF